MGDLDLLYSSEFWVYFECFLCLVVVVIMLGMWRHRIKFSLFMFLCDADIARFQFRVNHFYETDDNKVSWVSSFAHYTLSISKLFQICSNKEPQTANGQPLNRNVHGVRLLTPLQEATILTLNYINIGWKLTSKVSLFDKFSLNIKQRHFQSRITHPDQRTFYPIRLYLYTLV